MCMRINVVDDDDYVLDTINLEQYDLDDPDDIQRLIDFIMDIINACDEEI